jgi:hypothetical protein
VATTGAWPEALAYLSDHQRVTTDVRGTWVANRPCPDLRRVEYPRLRVVDRVSPNGHHSEGDQPTSVLQQLMAGVLNGVARVVLSLHSFATGG